MFSQTKILLVEDDPFLADLIISDIGILFPNNELLIIDPTDNYQDAVKKLNSEFPDIVLLDIELGEDKQAGIRLAQYINHTRPIPIIFLSGLERNFGFDIAKFTTPFGFLHKPYKRQELGDLLELLLVQLDQKKKTIEVIGMNTIFQNSSQPSSIFVATSHGELTAISLKDLVILEADGKVIRAYLLDQDKPVIFTSPGLKNFLNENRELLGNDFFQLSRKHVIRLSKIQQIKDNHVKLPRCSSNPANSYFFLPIPVNGDKKKELIALLGKKV